MTFFIFSSGDCVEKWWWHSLSDQHIGPFTQEIGPKNQLVPKKLGFKTGSRVSLMIFFYNSKWRLCRKVVVAFSQLMISTLAHLHKKLVLTTNWSQKSWALNQGRGSVFIFLSGDCVEKWWWHSLSDQHFGPFRPGRSRTCC